MLSELPAVGPPTEMSSNHFSALPISVLPAGAHPLTPSPASELSGHGTSSAYTSTGSPLSMAVPPRAAPPTEMPDVAELAGDEPQPPSYDQQT
jgi:hypothetical protein